VFELDQQVKNFPLNLTTISSALKRMPLFKSHSNNTRHFLGLIFDPLPPQCDICDIFPFSFFLPMWHDILWHFNVFQWKKMTSNNKVKNVFIHCRAKICLSNSNFVWKHSSLKHKHKSIAQNISRDIIAYPFYPSFDISWHFGSTPSHPECHVLIVWPLYVRAHGEVSSIAAPVTVWKVPFLKARIEVCSAPPAATAISPLQNKFESSFGIRIFLVGFGQA